MRIDRVELRDFGSHRHTVLEPGDARLVVIMGPNGVGKTTLASEALGYGLFKDITAIDLGAIAAKEAMRRGNVPPEKIDYCLFTHLVHAFITLGADGLPRMNDRIPSRDLAERARQAKVKLLLAIGGANSNRSLTQATSDPAGAERLVERLVELAVQSGYDGIDVDW